MKQYDALCGPSWEAIAKRLLQPRPRPIPNVTHEQDSPAEGAAAGKRSRETSRVAGR